MAFEWFYAFDHLPGAGAATPQPAMLGEGSWGGTPLPVALYNGRRRLRLAGHSAAVGPTSLVIPRTKAAAAGVRNHIDSVGTTDTNPAMPLDFRSPSGSRVCGLGVTRMGWQLYVGGAAVGSFALSAGAEQYLELGVDTVAGTAVVKSEGVVMLSYTGDMSALGEIAEFRLSGIASSPTLYMTDFYVRHEPADGSPFHGPILMRWLPVKEDVSVQWARNGGASNASRLIDPNGSDFDATYVESQTLGEIDEFTLEQLPPDVNSIIAVVPTSVSTAPSGGAPQIRRSLKTSAGTAPGPERTVGVGGWRTQMHSAMEKPGGGGWSRAAVGELRYLRESV